MTKDAVILDHFIDPLWKSTDKRFVILQGGAGSGKAVSLDTEVVTPYGPVLMKDIKVGDTICDTLGLDCKVINKWDNYRKMYELTLEDGRTVHVADCHMWEYIENGKHYEGDTKELINRMRTSDIYLPLTESVIMRDGFHDADVGTLAYILYGGCEDWHELPISESQLIRSKLLKGGKLVRSIPKAYTRLYIADRIDFLTALFKYVGDFDIDSYEFILKLDSAPDSKKVQKIVWSLGGRCSYKYSMLYGKYVLRFDFDTEKITQFIFGTRCFKGYYYHKVRPDGVRIVSIKQEGYDKCQCIEVDSPNHLYLVNDYIVTHNSAAICQRLCYQFLTQEDMVFAVVRATMPALTRSVYLGDPSIYKTLSEWGVPVDKWLNKTEATLRNPENGSVMYFIGLDDPEKIKSMNLNYIFIEEATEINADKWAQLNSRLRRHNKYGKNQMYIAYNPISYYNWVVQMFVVNPDPLIKDDTVVHFSNFSQNPYVSIDNMRSMFSRAMHDESYYRTYIIGKPGMPLGLIYPNFVFTASSTWPKEVWDVKPYYGIDWGYIDPMVLTECRDYDDKIYVRCLFYKTKVNTKDFIKFMEDSKISKTANIYYDSADAERGSLLMQAGFTAFKARKNINAGISFVKGFEVIVDSQGEFGQSAMDEIKAYTWETDPDDSSKFIEKPVGGYDHFADSCRYAIVTEHAYNRNFATASLDLSIDDALRKGGIYLGEGKD